MDLASIVGLVMCLVLVVFGITFDEGKIVFDNLYTFDDSEIKNGRKPKTKHNIKIEGISLNEEEFELIEKISNHYNMTVTKLVSFIVNQYYENKMNN